MSQRMAGQTGLHNSEIYFVQNAYSLNQMKFYLERFKIVFDNIQHPVVFLDLVIP